MSPRPRTVHDREILAAAARVIGRVGPARLTLALVADEVGLAPATLIQRFGSKRGLLLAIAESGREDPGPWLARLRERHPSPLAALREFLIGFTRMASTPDEMANHLAFFQMDLTDPDLRRVTQAVFAVNERAVTGLLRDAVAAGELRRVDPEALAPVLLTVAQGSLLSWAVHRKGSARAWARRHVETALQPYLAG
ncbi:MAG: TetR/AcrR family transcriptional regulator [Gammaproteobacteria bacterium]|nr:TetR/AcrR family transcriptional regulator [Gammaproteobacteria bacterium]